MLWTKSRFLKVCMIFFIVILLLAGFALLLSVNNFPLLSARVAPFIYNASFGRINMLIPSSSSPSATSLNIAKSLSDPVNVPPVASLYANPVTGQAPLTTIFNASGSADIDGVIASYQWDFGDGAVAVGLSATHEYSQEGLYSATLIVTDEDGATATESTIINASGQAPANNPPAAIFNILPESGTAPLDVFFNASGSTDSDGTITSYSWDFGDGSTGSGITTSHTYSQAGQYITTLTVTDNDSATGTYSRSITVLDSSPVNIPPLASFETNPQTGQVPLTVSFDASGTTDTDGTIASYSWDFGDGQTGTGVLTTHEYVAPATYIINLTVTDDNGATGTSTAIVTATGPTTSPSPSSSPDPTVSASPSAEPTASMSPDPTPSLDPSASPEPGENLPPEFMQIPPQEVEPGEVLDLDPTVYDDGLPDPPADLAYQWSVSSGLPQDVKFSDVHTRSTQATFAKDGQYELSLEISDGEQSVTMTVAVTVQDKEAGSEISITGKRHFTVRPGGTVNIPVVIKVKRPTLTGLIIGISTSIFNFVLE